MSISDQSHILSFVSDAHARLDAATTPQPDQPGASARSLRAALPPLITVAQTIWLPGLIDSLTAAQAALDSLRRQSLDADPLADSLAAEIRSGLDQTLDLIAAGNLSASIPESLSKELKDLVRAAGGFVPPPVSARPAPVKRFTAEDLVPKPFDPPTDAASTEAPQPDPSGELVTAHSEAESNPLPLEQTFQDCAPPDQFPGSTQPEEHSAAPAESASSPAVTASDTTAPDDTAAATPGPAEPAPLSWEVHPEDYFAHEEAIPAEVVEPDGQADAVSVTSKDVPGITADPSAQSPAPEAGSPTAPQAEISASQSDAPNAPRESDPWETTTESSAGATEEAGLAAILASNQTTDPESAGSSISPEGSAPADAPAPGTDSEAPTGLAALGDLHDKVGKLLTEFAKTHDVPPLAPELDADAEASYPGTSASAPTDAAPAPENTDAQNRLAALGDLHDQVGQLLADFAAASSDSTPATASPANGPELVPPPAVGAVAEPAIDPGVTSPEPAAQPVTSSPTAEPANDHWDVGPEPTAGSVAEASATEPTTSDDADLASILGSLETTDSATAEPEASMTAPTATGDAAEAAAGQPADADAAPGLAELGELQSKISQLLASFPLTLDEAAPAPTQPEPIAEVPAPANPPAPLDSPSEPESAAQPELPSQPEPEPTAADALDEAANAATDAAADLTPPPNGPDDAGFAGPAELTPEQMAAMMNDMGDPGLGGDAEFVASEWGSFPVQITPEQVENLQFMVADAKAGIEQMAANITNLAQFGTRDEACVSLAETSASVQKICDSFEFASLRTLSSLMQDVATSAATVSDGLMPELLVRASGIHSLIEQHVRGLECGMEMRWPLATLAHRTKRLLAGLNVHPLIRGWHKGDVFSLLELDGVSEGAEPPPKPEDEDNFVETGVIAAATAPAVPTQAEAAAAAAAAGTKKSDTESIIRVNASTIDGMLELISQLVLSKNRVFNLSRVLRLPGDQNARLDELATAADELAMLTANLQLTMMQARMQPTSKLFERYDRVVRDLAGLADKKVNLVTGGQNAMIDKNMFDGLGEALAQLLRSIVTKQVRKADQRTAEGRPDTATITLDAQSQGSQIIISVEHDGDAPDRAAIASVAIEKGLQTAEGLDTLSDNDLFLLPFELDYGDPQLSTVGQNIQKLGGTITIRLTDTGLTRIEIALPLSVAIVAAILVGIGTESYAIPLQSVEEIIRVSDFQCSMINNRPVIRLREDILDIVEASSIVGSVPAAASQAPTADSTHPNDIAAVDHEDAATAALATTTATATAEAPAAGEFGVLLSSGVNRAVLTVDRIIGKQEIVIKKLTGSLAHNRHFAGATIRNDGGISLIFEVAELLRINR